MTDFAPSIGGRPLRLLFAGLMVGLLVSELEQTVFATALPTIVGDLDGAGHMLWVTTSYVLAATIVMPVYGKLGDLAGRKPLFIMALALFVAGSLIGGLSQQMSVLIVGRAVQGLGGGGLLVLTQAIVADIVPARRRAPYMSVIGAVFAVSAAAGPLLGGWFADGIGWRWVFWINIPLGGVAIALAIGFLHLPASGRGVVRIDVRGLAAMTIAVTALVLVAAWGGTEYAWISPVVVGLGLVAVVSGVLFVAAERTAAEPLIPPAMFGQRNFTVATVGAAVMAVAMFGVITYLPTYLQMVSGLGATASGLMMLTLVAGLGISTVVSAQIVSRTGCYSRLPVIGSAVVTVALLMFSALPEGTDLRLVGGVLFLFGVGIGCGLEVLVVTAQNAVHPSQQGTATATHAFFREVGVSLGAAVIGSVFTSRLTALLTQRSPVGLRPSGGDRGSLTPELVRRLAPALRGPVISAYHDALTTAFRHAVPLLVLSAIALAFLRPVPLATRLTEPAEDIRAAVGDRIDV